MENNQNNPQRQTRRSQTTGPVDTLISSDTQPGRGEKVSLLALVIFTILALISIAILQCLESKISGQLDRRNYFLGLAIGFTAAALFSGFIHFKNKALYIVSLPLAVASFGVLVHELLLDQPYQVGERTLTWAILLTIALLPWSARLIANLNPSLRHLTKSYDTYALIAAFAVLFRQSINDDNAILGSSWTLIAIILIIATLTAGITLKRKSLSMVSLAAAAVLFLMIRVLFMYVSAF